MLAASGLDIIHTYRIKLVIADGNTQCRQMISAFLEANSFNIDKMY
jgi:hypothetical protein